MRRFLSFLLALVCLFGLVSCGVAESVPAPAESETAPAAEESAPVAEEPAPTPEPDTPPVILAEPSYSSSSESEWDSCKEPLGVEEFFAGSIRVFLSGSEGENRLCSPLNISMALAMLAESTDGETRAQLLELLGAEDLDTLRERSRAIWQRLYRDDEALVLIPANSLWLDRELDCRSETAENLAEHYYASCFQGDMGSEAYDELLRSWMEEQTRGLLHDSVSDLRMDPGQVIALVSTVYFKSSWWDPFSEEKTAEGVFHSPDGDESADFMYQSFDSADIYRTANFTAVSLGLRDGNYMWFLLPAEGLTPEELLQDEEVMSFLLSPEKWFNCLRLRSTVYLKLTVPKFDVKSELDLIDGLRQLGATDAFDPSLADFSPLVGDWDGVCISRAQHAARLMIDEKGCEAAAYTKMDGDWASDWCDETVDLVLDRPFLFAVTVSDYLPLFVGLVNHPSN